MDGYEEIGSVNINVLSNFVFLFQNSDSNFGTAPVTPASQSPSNSHIASMQESAINDKTSHHSNLSLEPDPILFGKLAGRQEVRLKLKQSEGVLGPKVDLEVNLGSLTTFLSARQFHVLIELLHGLATPDLEDTRYWKFM